jgi:hypothetical protein
MTSELLGTPAVGSREDGVAGDDLTLLGGDDNGLSSATPRTREPSSLLDVAFGGGANGWWVFDGGGEWLKSEGVCGWVTSRMSTTMSSGSSAATEAINGASAAWTGYETFGDSGVGVGLGVEAKVGAGAVRYGVEADLWREFESLRFGELGVGVVGGGAEGDMRRSWSREGDPCDPHSAWLTWWNWKGSGDPAFECTKSSAANA